MTDRTCADSPKANRPIINAALKRALIIPIAAILWATGCRGQDPASPERAVSVLEEPRHRVVHSAGDLYLMDVQIQPGDTTLPRTHDAAMLYTIIHDESGPTGGVTDVNTDEQTAWLTQSNPVIVVQVTEGSARMAQHDGKISQLAGAGQWAWQNPGSRFRIRNVGSHVIRLVIKEGRI